MRNKLALICVHLIAGLIITPSIFAWTGEASFTSQSRENIRRIASEMIELSWTPHANFQYNSEYPFKKGTVYRGEAYTQHVPMENWSEFYSCMDDDNNHSNDYYQGCSQNHQGLGNDCSGFVSMSWKMPERYDTTAFNCDAVNSASSCNNYTAGSNDYATKLGDIGSAQNIVLLPGDALVRTASAQHSGHIVIFDEYEYDERGNKIGIKTLEQVCDTWVDACWAKRVPDKRRWSYLADYRPIRRNKIDEGNYTFVTKWGAPGTSAGLFNAPTGVATDSSGNVYVVDQLNHCAQKFDSNGNFITKWGSEGTGNGYFQYPNGISVDSAGYVYVTDDLNSRIQKFTSGGSFITKWGSQGSGNGQFLGVLNVTANTSNVYVSDSYLSSIQKFTSSGSYISQWGSEGSGNGQFYGNRGIAVDSSLNVYVADAYNNRIQKFNSGGSFITKWGACCSPDGYFNEPHGIAVDLSGNVYVADTHNHRIQKFDSNGNFITKWGSWGLWDENGKFQYPFGVAVDSSLNVYVADTFNDRIQKFAPVSPYPARPTAVTATTISANQIRLNWTDNSNNEMGFDIFRKTGIRGNWFLTRRDTANAASYTDTLPGPGTYYYVVYAYSSAGYSAWSNEVSATVNAQQANIMDVPTGTASYTYGQVATPVLSYDPASAKPIAIVNSDSTGSSATNLFSVSGSAVVQSQAISDGALTMRVGFLQFGAPVDLYLALSSPEIDPDNVYWFDQDNALHSSAEGFVKWRENSVGPIDEIIWDNMPVSIITPATYYVYAVVTPPGDTTKYYIWDTYFQITTQACSNLPVMLQQTSPAYYSSIQSAYNAAGNGIPIETQAINFAENPNFNRDIAVVLKGGFNCDYSNNTATTSITGSLTISSGTVTIENIEIK